MDAQALLSYGRKYFNNSREPFRIYVAGTEIYIITSPQDMSRVYKNTISLSFDDFILDLHVAFGMSPKGRDVMWNTSKGKILIHVADDLHHAQLLPGKHLDDVTDRMLAQIEHRLSWEQMSADGIQIVRSDGKPKALSLYTFCADILVPATTVAFFGDALLGVDENLINDLHAFDANGWMLTYRYPRLLARKMHHGKDMNTEAFTKYFQLPLQDRPGACHYVRSLEARQREAGMPVRDIAISIQLFFWVANTNAYKICFWMLTYLLHRPTFFEKVNIEVCRNCASPNMSIKDLVENPLLTAAFDETLRLVSGASSARTVKSPTQLGEKTLRKDVKLLMPYRQLHFDAEIFGPRVKEFHPERFLDNQTLGRSPNFKPFGGGTTYCSGRFIAKREVLYFVAQLLHKYDVGLADPNATLPRLDEQKPSLGVLEPIKGDDTLITITPKLIS